MGFRRLGAVSSLWKSEAEEASSRAFPPHLPRETRNVAEVGGEARHETRPLRTTQTARPQANFWGGKRAVPLDIGN